MQYDILLTKTAGNGYTARPLLWPEIVVSGDNEAETIARVRKALAATLDKSRVVQIDLSAPPIVDDPWLQAAGMWGEIPDDEWESFQHAVATVRLTEDQGNNHLQNSDSEI